MSAGKNERYPYCRQLHADGLTVQEAEAIVRAHMPGRQCTIPDMRRAVQHAFEMGLRRETIERDLEPGKP